MIPIRGLRAPVQTKPPEQAGRLVHQARGPMHYRIPPSRWTETMDAELRRLWEVGTPSAVVAESIGGNLSRNAVIGRARRLGLNRRPSPIGERP